MPRSLSGLITSSASDRQCRRKDAADRSLAIAEPAATNVNVLCATVSIVHDNVSTPAKGAIHPAQPDLTAIVGRIGDFLIVKHLPQPVSKFDPTGLSICTSGQCIFARTDRATNYENISLAQSRKWNYSHLKKMLHQTDITLMQINIEQPISRQDAFRYEMMLSNNGCVNDKANSGPN